MKRNLIILSTLSLFLLTVSGVFAKPPGKGDGEPPSNLTAQAASASQIDLNWQYNSNNEDGFTVERSLDGVSFTEIATAAENTVQYSDTGLNSGTQYYYRVRSFRTHGNKTKYSSYSNTASAETFADLPLAPSSLIAYSQVSTSTPAAVLQWQDNANNEDGFKVERALDGISFIQIADLPYANATGYNDYDVTIGTTYFYQVKAYNSAGNSDYSNIASVLIE